MRAIDVSHQAAAAEQVAAVEPVAAAERMRAVRAIDVSHRDPHASLAV